VVKVKVLKGVLGVICAALLVVTLVLLGGVNKGTRAAATVNGKVITEQEVTEQIDVLRKQYGCTDDEAWAKLLGQSGMTAEDMRKQVIDYKAQVMLVNAAASEQGIEVTDAEVEQQVNQTREAMGYADDASWEEFLSTQGFTEAAYDEQVATSLRLQKLVEQFSGGLTDEQLQNYVDEFASFFETDSWKAPEGGGHIDLGSVPEDVLEKMRSGAQSYYANYAYEDYVEDLTLKADIAIKPMPKGLSYDVEPVALPPAGGSDDDAAQQMR
jgi:hypothetical protein